MKCDLYHTKVFSLTWDPIKRWWSQIFVSISFKCQGDWKCQSKEVTPDT